MNLLCCRFCICLIFWAVLNLSTAKLARTDPGSSLVSRPRYEGRRVLVVAGNFTLDGERLNIAQFDIGTNL